MIRESGQENIREPVRKDFSPMKQTENLWLQIASLFPTKFIVFGQRNCMSVLGLRAEPLDGALRAARTSRRGAAAPAPRALRLRPIRSKKV